MKFKTLTAKMFALAGAIVAIAATTLPVDAKVTQHKSSPCKATVNQTTRNVVRKATQTRPPFPTPNGARVSVAPPRATDPPRVKPPYRNYSAAEYYRLVREYDRIQNARAQQLPNGQAATYQNYASHYGQYVQQYGARVGDLNKCDNCPSYLRGSVLNSADERRYWTMVHEMHALILRGRKMNGDLFTNREEVVEEAMRLANIAEYLRTHRNPETNIAP